MDSHHISNIVSTKSKTKKKTFARDVQIVQWSRFVSINNTLMMVDITKYKWLQSQLRDKTKKKDEEEEEEEEKNFTPSLSIEENCMNSIC